MILLVKHPLWMAVSHPLAPGILTHWAEETKGCRQLNLWGESIGRWVAGQVQKWHTKCWEAVSYKEQVKVCVLWLKSTQPSSAWRFWRKKPFHCFFQCVKKAAAGNHSRWHISNKCREELHTALLQDTVKATIYTMSKELNKFILKNNYENQTKPA